MKKSAFLKYMAVLAAAAPLCIGLLAGCGSGGARSVIMAAPPNPADRITGEPEAPPAEAAPEAAATPADEPVDLKIIAANLTGAFTGDDAGCYRTVTFPDGTADIHYTSYETLSTRRLDIPQKITQLQLGQVLGCRGGAAPVLFGGQLFLFQSGGASGLDDEDGNPVQAILQRLDAHTGASARLLFPAQYAFATEGAVLGGGGALYFTMFDRGSAETAPASVLVQVDVASMAYTVLHRLPEGCDYTVQGVWQKGPVLCAAQTLPATDDSGFADAWTNRTYSLLRMGLASGQTEPLFTWRQGLSWTPCENRFYYWSDTDKTLYVLNTDTGETLAAASGFVPENYERVQLQSAVRDGRLEVLVSTSGLAASCVIDLATGALTTPPVFTADAGEEGGAPVSETAGEESTGETVESETPLPLVIHAVSASHYMVQSGERWAHRRVVEPGFEGEEPVFNDNYVRVPVYALILKEDYWAGLTRLTPIEDLVYV